MSFAKFPYIHIHISEFIHTVYFICYEYNARKIPVKFRTSAPNYYGMNTPNINRFLHDANTENSSYIQYAVLKWLLQFFFHL
jgi:hypothetical protein